MEEGREDREGEERGGRREEGRKQFVNLGEGERVGRGMMERGEEESEGKGRRGRGGI